MRKIIPRHSKSIEITFTNMVTKAVCFRVTMPHDVKKEFSIAKFYKAIKPAIATGEGVPAFNIAAKHQIIDSERIGRIFYEWPGGLALDMPYDSKEQDYQIVVKQLEVMMMAFN
jgi:hypothetical protein